MLRRWPEVAAVDCAFCQKHVMKDNWQPEMRAGKPLPRPSGTFPPCRYPQQGCPKGTPETPRTLSEQNTKAYAFHKECEAVGQWPDDAIVRRNAAIIKAAEAACDRAAAERQTKLLEAFLGVTANVR